ncbi:MAG: hypothetical protein H0W86_04805 [Armatimonadetes bacterium]|nr:hypothetical protein [Armatimonadota bacterium]
MRDDLPHHHAVDLVVLPTAFIRSRSQVDSNGRMKVFSKLTGQLALIYTEPVKICSVAYSPVVSMFA